MGAAVGSGRPQSAAPRISARRWFGWIVGTALLAAAAAGEVPTPIGEQERRCLRYEPVSVTLDGIVVYRTFADANGKPERTALLLLDGPVCVDGVDDLNVGEFDQLLVQLNRGANPEKFGREPQLAGQRVQARGSLYHGHSAHHHAPLILTVESLTISPRAAAGK
ncbi:MAG: DUF4431 domain-containing protein [Deltaproteobacteria bacterium]|nr:DUF4431 domain-containing protein [Deltaproteobacteria bacterium]